jgi:allantoate deiminase
MKINEKRLLHDLRHLRSITATPGRGVTRLTYSREDQEARNYITSIAKAFHFNIRVDGIGNILIAPPASRARVLTGSHIDTVIHGGWLDGAYGVISALEVLRTFAENDYPHDAALIIFAEEEGTNFGSTMTGSKFLTGKYGDAQRTTLCDSQGRSLSMLAQEAGLDPAENILPLTGAELMIELHIEQGPVLEENGCDLGIVDTIFGQTTIRVTMEGLGNHAGASPMQYRKDALMAACEGILAAEKAVASDPYHRAVMTVGRINASPDCSNVIPEEVIFTLEVRDSDTERMQQYIDEIEVLMQKAAKHRRVGCRIDPIASSAAIPMTPSVVSSMDRLAREKQLAYRIMNSGAVHDTAMMADIMGTGMIFVPSASGRSHVPQEDTAEEQLIAGANFLLDVLREKAGR